MMHDMIYQEFKATNLIHGADNSAILCYEDKARSNRLISAPPKSIEGYHKSPKTPDKWSNQIQWVASSGTAAYSAVKGLLDYIRQHPDFNMSFENLVKNVYKIKEAELSRLSGVHEKKIQRIMNI